MDGDASEDQPGASIDDGSSPHLGSSQRLQEPSSAALAAMVGHEAPTQPTPKDLPTSEGLPEASTSPRLKTIQHGPNAITGVIESGEAGLDSQGGQVRDRSSSTTSTAYSVYAAQGKAPEMIATTSPRKAHPEAQEDGTEGGGSTLTAFAKALPTTVLGLDLTGLKTLAGGAEGASSQNGDAVAPSGDAANGHADTDGKAESPHIRIEAPSPAAQFDDGDESSDDESQPLPFASQKDNAKFHAIFPSLQQSEPLIASYPCALQRDILVQGKLYLSSSHLCFKANIFGWRTLLILPLSEVVSIQKRTYARMFQNALTVCTTHAKNIFASLLHRDQTYEEIVKIWKVKHGRGVTETYRGKTRRSSGSVAPLSDGEGAATPKQEARRKKIREHEGVRDDTMAGTDVSSSSESSDSDLDGENGEDHRSPSALLVPSQTGGGSRPSSVRSAPSPLSGEDFRSGPPPSPEPGDGLKAKTEAPSRGTPSKDSEASSIRSGLASGSSTKRRKRSRSFRFGRSRKDTDTDEDGALASGGDGLSRVTTGHGSLRKAMIEGLGFSKSKKSRRSETTDPEDDSDDEQAQGDEEAPSNDDHAAATDAQAVADSYRRRAGSAEQKEAKASKKGKKKDQKGKKAAGGQAKGTSKAHRPTECPCGRTGEHYDAVAIDAVYPTTPEKMYSLMFSDHKFFAAFMEDDQKVTDLRIGDWENISEGDESLKTREMDYVKPLNASFGPKTTKCYLTEENINVDFDDYVTTMTTTRTPDVPCGSNFTVKTRTCITYVEGGGTRVLVTTGVEWSKVNRMLKGVIERSAIDGQKSTHSALDAAIRKHIDAHKDEYLVAASAATSTKPAKEGAGPTAAAAAAAATSDIPGGAMGVVQGFTDAVGGPTVAALLLVVSLLAFTNWWTWRSMRYYHAGSAQGIALEAERMTSSIEDLERRLASLKGRLDDLGRFR